MKFEKKVTAYPSGDSIKMIEGFVYDYKYFVNELFQASVEPFVQVGNRASNGRKSPVFVAENYLHPTEECELQTLTAPVQECYDMVALKNYCEFIQQKGMLIKKIKSQADVYLGRNISMLRFLVIHTVGLVLSVVAAVICQHAAGLSATGIDWIGIAFKCMSIYLCVFIFYQSLKAVVNTIISKHELSYWKKTTVGLLDEKEYTRYITSPLVGLKRSLYVTYPLIIMGYVYLSYYSYKLPYLLQNNSFSWL